MKTKILVYGVLGYTGNLFLERALDRSLPIVLGAREAELRGTAQRLGLDHRVFEICDTQSIAACLSDIRAVVNLASISYSVNRFLIDACIQTGTHYVDLAAECSDMIQVLTHHDAALARGVMLMPGAGFNVIMTDIAGVIASESLAEPTRLCLGFATFGRPSRGTIRSLLRLATEPGYTRRAGELVAARSALQRRTFRAEGKDYSLISNASMGDVITSFRSTGIRDIAAFSYYPWILAQFMRGRLNWLRVFLNRYARWFFALGPSDGELESQHTYAWAQVENARGGSASVVITGPHAYIFTVKAIGRIIDQLVRNNVNPGFTPPSFFGRPLIEGIDGVRITVAVDGDQGRVHEVPRGGASGPDEGLGRPPRRP
jgi:short subunit dehydrogenase-like uncharacterized protein